MLNKSGFLQNFKIRILLAVEIMLVLAGVLGLLFDKGGVVCGVGDTERLLSEGVSLSAGMYKLRLYYDTTDEIPGDFGVYSDETLPYKSILANNVPIYPGINSRDCDFTLKNRVDKLQVELNLSENVDVTGLELTKNKGGYMVFIFIVIVLSICIDFILAIWMYNKNVGLCSDKKLVFWGIPAVSLISSLPSMVDYNIIGADIIFHMMRIEALVNSIVQGEFTVRMQSAWLAGHGYANSFFYGDTCLIIPALLRIIGFNTDSALRLFIIIINTATAVIAYISFKECFNNRYIGMFGAALYTLAPYRIYNIYNRGALGEFIAMAFLPLLVWGFYRIYTEDVNKKGYLWNFAIPVTGFSGIIQSHTLSCEMAGVFVALACLILLKRTFTKKVFMALCLTVVMTVLINAWFLVPFIDLMAADSYYFGHNANVLIQNRGIYPAQIFYTLQAGGLSSRFHETGMLNTEPIGMGAALLFGMGLWVFARANRKNGAQELKQNNYAGDLLFLLCVIALIMSTNLFPWDTLSKMGKLPATLIGSLQFPTRLTAIVTILAVSVSCFAAKHILQQDILKRDVISGRVIIGVIALLSVLFSMYQVNDILLTRDEIIRIYTYENIGHSAVLGAEYLPEGADITHMTYHDAVCAPGTEIGNYEKKGLKITAEVKSDGGYIDFPLLYYKGYSAKDMDTGEKLLVSKGENVDVRVEFPAGFSSRISLSYTGMWYWHVAEVISILTGLVCVGIYAASRRRRNGD